MPQNLKAEKHTHFEMMKSVPTKFPGVCFHLILVMCLGRFTALAAFTPPPGTYRTSWMGNSLPGDGGPNGFGYWMQNGADEIEVTPGGPDQQIKFYGVSSAQPKFVSTFGDKGGSAFRPARRVGSHQVVCVARCRHGCGGQFLSRARLQRRAGGHTRFAFLHAAQSRRDHSLGVGA